MQFRLYIFFFLFASLCLVSCEKTPEYSNIFIEDDKANIVINSGFNDKEVNLTSDSWRVVYVRFINPTLYLLDDRLQLMRLESVGRVKSSLGFITLERKNNEPNSLFISMTENFKEEPRRLIIGLQDGEQVKELVITQKRGANYEMSGKRIEELAGSRSVKTLNIHQMSVDNNASTELTITTPIKDFFQSANYSSNFQSEDQAAFDWTPLPDSLIDMEPITHEGVNCWDEKVKYVRGNQVSPYMDDATEPINKVVPPYSKMTVFAEVTFLSRECIYSFQIVNKETGHKTILNGNWKQTVPIHSEIKTK